MNEKLTACPLCNSQDHKLYLTGEDYFLTNERFDIVECLSCGFRFTNPRPTVASAEKYYQTKEYISHDSGEGGIMPALYGIARHFTLRIKFKIVRRYSPGGSILDIGCGTGEFLHYCQQKGLVCEGVEPAGKAREFAEKKYGLDVKTDFLTGIMPTKRFDCITLWHVLEHIHKLDETLKKINGLLNRDGVLIVALPNCNSHDAIYYRKFWAAYDLPRHIFHFTRDTLNALANKYDLSCIEILPQKLDAYYISLLSEKYKRNSPDYFRAFVRGLQSNSKARNPQIGHSSEIYILKSKIS